MITIIQTTKTNQMEIEISLLEKEYFDILNQFNEKWIKDNTADMAIHSNE